MSNTAEEDTLKVSRVYDNLKSPTFLKNLYWDILSGIKEKDTYKYMRGMAESIINQNMEVLNGLNNSEIDNFRRRTIVAEICTMSYTIDSVFSKILYMKLEKACREQIVNIIQQLNNEKKIPESLWSKFEVKTETIEAETSAENSIVRTDEARPTRNIQKTPVRVGRRKRKVISNSYNSLYKGVKPNSNKEILEDLKKVNGVKEVNVDQNSANSKKGNVSQKKLGGRIKELPKRNASGANSSLQKLTKDNVSLLSSVVETSEKGITHTPKNSLQADNQDASDAESEISLGNLSFASLSSVHTSDLSSFDDQISLSSDDESGKKRKVSLKEVQKKFSESSNLDSSIASKNDAKSSKSLELKASVDDTPSKSKSEYAAASLASPNENGLPKRARKPNSRYSSDNIVCTVLKVKDRKKGGSHMSDTNGKSSSDELLPQKKKLKVENDIIGDVATITRSITNEGNYDVTPLKKQPETPDLFKSYSANRSLTSRRTAPVTLFST